MTWDVVKGVCLFCLCRFSWSVLHLFTALWMHWMPKWLLINHYSFIFMLISLSSIISMRNIQKNFHTKMRPVCLISIYIKNNNSASIYAFNVFCHLLQSLLPNLSLALRAMVKLILSECSMSHWIPFSVTVPVGVCMKGWLLLTGLPWIPPASSPTKL